MPVPAPPPPAPPPPTPPPPPPPPLSPPSPPSVESPCAIDGTPTTGVELYVTSATDGSGAKPGRCVGDGGFYAWNERWDIVTRSGNPPLNASEIEAVKDLTCWGHDKIYDTSVTQFRNMCPRTFRSTLAT